ncbi:MAG: 5-formyltetrahydrofolate cyclo-ligase [Pseudomonadota bacterium]|nr:5-formyltetrahydrofolate cyclo-ligase [Pseudomonadota bacterium]
MNGDEKDGAPAEYASPPCFMHELDPAFAGLEMKAAPGQTDPGQASDVARWRKAERARLIERRLALPAQDRRRHEAFIAAHLLEAMGPLEGRVVSAYWAFRGEPNLYPLLSEVIARGGRCALPVVTARGEPLVFRSWAPGDRLDRGVWNIPIPPADAPRLVPDIVIAPVVGFDRAGYRLGYGGGFFDRTLAKLVPRPRVFGVGYSLAAIPTIYPQWHDIAMDCVITEQGLAEAG